MAKNQVLLAILCQVVALVNGECILVSTLCCFVILNKRLMTTLFQNCQTLPSQCNCTESDGPVCEAPPEGIEWGCECTQENYNWMEQNQCMMGHMALDWRVLYIDGGFISLKKYWTKFGRLL